MRVIVAGPVELEKLANSLLIRGITVRRLRNVADFHYKVRHEEELFGAIICPCNWWNRRYIPASWGMNKPRPAVLTVSPTFRDTEAFLADCVTSLNAADDCVPTDIHPDEMMARIEAIHRRVSLCGGQTTNEVEAFGFRIDMEAPRFYYRDKPIYFTITAGTMLLCLARNAGRTLTKWQIVERMYDTDPAQEKIVDVYMSKIRTRLSLAGMPRADIDKMLETVWAQGIRFNLEEKALHKVRGNLGYVSELVQA